MIDFTITGDEAVIGRLRAMPPRIQAAITATMQREMIGLSGYIKAEKLSGQVLKTRTGTLRRKVNARVTASETAVTGQVGVQLAYAAIHEYGFDGTEQVRAHTRTIHQAFGHALASPVVVQVQSFSRHMKMPERSFLRAGLRERAPGILSALETAATEAAA